MSAETLAFKTELKQLLHLIIHSLYSHKDIFLRELISNASDAIDAARFEGLTKPELLEGNDNWRIDIVPDPDKGTLTISDNGIGMSRETIVDNLGTIARSGTRQFIERLKSVDVKERPELIGQFGVGFYSAFMVADKVTVVSRMAGKPEDGVKWESDGQGEYTVEAFARPTRGTDVIVHLRPEDREFLDPHNIRRVVKKYSDFVGHPIVLHGKEEDKETKDTLNSGKALWLRAKSEIKAEEYDEFYKHVSHDFEKPLKVVHYAAEGTIEFKALLYIPAHRPYELNWGDSKKGLHLYIQRVFIMDDCEALLPKYLRFVRGVVDSPDLPLNVSREILQQSAPLEKIKSNLTNKVLSTLDEMKRKELDNYLKFYTEMGVFLKEGVTQDWSNRERLADLLLFESTKTDKGKYTSLAEYIERMPGDQQEILYLTGDSRDLMEQSPYLEGPAARGQEVLFLAEPIDEFLADSLRDYKGKKLQAVDRITNDAGIVDEEKQKRFQSLLDYMRDRLPEIKEARISRRLKESAVCLVSEAGAMSAHMERLLQRMSPDKPPPTGKRILEINADHALLQKLQAIHALNASDPRLESYCRLLYDQAVIAEGSKVKDPLAFARRMNEVLLGEKG